MKNFLAQIAVIFIFIIQTAFPFNTSIWAINLAPVLSYLVATAFVLPFDQSIVILIILAVIYYLTGSSLLIPFILLCIAAFSITRFIRKNHISKLLSFSYLFLLFFGTQIAIILIYYLQNSIGWQELTLFFISKTLPEIIGNWVIAIIFIYILQFIFYKPKASLDIE